MSKYLTTSLCLVSLLVGVGIGFMLTPEYSRQETATMEYMNPNGRDTITDREFLDAMIAYSADASAKASQAKELSKRNEIVTLAQNILEKQTKDNEQLYALRKKLFNDTTKVTPGNNKSINLGDYDELFDLRFLNAMNMHHMDAVSLSREVLQQSSTMEILNFANATIASNMPQMSIMEGWRNEWYESDHDLAYLQMVIKHHGKAIGVLKQIVEKSKRVEFKEFASAVIDSDTKAIAELSIVKRALFPGDNKPIDTPTIPDLGNWDDQFDQRALRELITMLNEAINMAKEMQVKVMHPESKNVVEGVLSTIPSVVEKLENWEKSWYSISKDV